MHISRYVLGLAIIAFSACSACSPTPSAEQQNKADEATKKALSNHDSDLGFKPLPRFGESPTPK
jgi:hypothetical protein